MRLCSKRVKNFSNSLGHCLKIAASLSAAEPGDNGAKQRALEIGCTHSADKRLLCGYFRAGKGKNAIAQCENSGAALARMKHRCLCLAGSNGAFGGLQKSMPAAQSPRLLPRCGHGPCCPGGPRCPGVPSARGSPHAQPSPGGFGPLSAPLCPRGPLGPGTPLERHPAQPAPPSMAAAAAWEGGRGVHAARPPGGGFKRSHGPIRPLQQAERSHSLGFCIPKEFPLNSA